MIIKLSPVLPLISASLTIYKQGDSLTINGLTLDLGQFPEGATLPSDAVDCEWLAGAIERTDGHLTIPLTLPLPHGVEAMYEARFPADIVNPANGRVPLPIPEAVEPSQSQGYAVIDWGQLVTVEAKAQAAVDQLQAAATVEIARRRSLADAAIAPLQDAVDLEEATEDETDLLKQWKRYRVALNRLHEQEAYPAEIDWPAPPA